jgi:hypothetical protein
VSEATKLTGSLAQSGLIRANNHITQIKIKFTASFIKNKCENLVFNALESLEPPGALLPEECKRIK